MVILGIALILSGLFLAIYDYKYSGYGDIDKPFIFRNNRSTVILFTGLILLVSGFIILFILDFFITLLIFVAIVLIVALLYYNFKSKIKKKNPKYYKQLNEEKKQYKSLNKKDKENKNKSKNDNEDIVSNDLTPRGNENSNKSNYLFSKLDNKLHYDIYLVESLKLFEENKLDEAEIKVKRAMLINPFFYAAYLNLGGINKKRKEYDLALNNFNKALEMDNEILKIYLSRASTYYEMGKLEEAVKDIDHILSIDDSYATAFYLKGLIEIQNENYSSALTNLEKASILDNYYENTYEMYKSLYGDSKNLYDDIYNDNNSNENSENTAFIRILDFIFENIDYISTKEEFEKITLYNIELMGEDESFIAQSRKQNLTSIFGNLPPGNVEFNYEVRNTIDPIIIAISFYQNRVVNFDIQIIFKDDENGKRDLLFEELSNYFSSERAYVFIEEKDLGYTGYYLNFIVEFHILDELDLKSIYVSFVDLNLH